MENTSQGASWLGNSLYRFFKRVPDVEELCEGPVPAHLLGECDLVRLGSGTLPQSSLLGNMCLK